MEMVMLVVLMIMSMIAGWFTTSTTCVLTGYDVYFSGLGYKRCSL